MKITTLCARAHVYNKAMPITSSIHPHKTKSARILSWIVAGMLLVMLLSQLYGYEAFAALLFDIVPFHDSTQTIIFAAFIVTLELLALPYLLEMRLSKLMRFCSAVSGLLVGLFWLFMSLTSAHAANSALFSDTIEVPGGIIAAVWSLILVSCMISVLYLNSRTT